MTDATPERTNSPTTTAVAAGSRISAAQFLDARPEMPERGAWSELVRGRPVHFDAPDVDHGDVLGNLTRRLAPLAGAATPVFRVGLQTARDTIRFPAVSYFDSPGRFDLMDVDVVTEAPAWVIEIVSTADRIRTVPERVSEYAAAGVRLLWFVDPAARSVHIIGREGPAVVSEDGPASARPVADFEATPAELCAPPSWFA